MKTTKLLFIFCTVFSKLILAQCDFGTGSVLGNPAPFSNGSAAVTVNVNDVTVVANTNMPGGIYNFNNFTVNAGVVITVVSGLGPLEIRCIGTSTINGTIRADGGNGGNGTQGTFSGGIGGAGGIGGGGWGANGGLGGSVGLGVNGNPGLNFGTSTGSGSGGIGNSSSAPWSAGGGGGAGYFLNGTAGNTTDGGAGGAAGNAYGDVNLTTSMTYLGYTTSLLGGSGGGGGGNRGNISRAAGGGGGGGGGAIQIVANSIVFGAAGLVSVKGGDGGTSINNGGAYGGSGGGGSGGTINLKSSNIVGFTAGINSNILGGTGGTSSGSNGGPANGGNGSPGRILVEPCNVSTNTISAGVTAGQPVCAGASTTIPFTSFGTFTIGNTYTVQLSDANGNFGSPINIGTLASTANSGTISITIPPGTTTGNLYQIRIVSSNPIATSGNLNQVAITAAVTPSVSISSNAGTSICAGASVDFTATPTNGGTTPSYAWTINGNPAGTGSTLTTNSLTNGAVIQAILTSNAACAVPTNTNSNSITMTVNSSLIPAVSISSDLGNTICSGSSVTFSATPTNGGTTPTYAWTLNGNPAGTNSSTYNPSAISQGDVVALTLTSSDACANPTTANSNSITLSVNPTVTPSISITANPGNVICSGTFVDFLQLPLNGGSSAVYEWFINGVSQGFATNGFSSSTLLDGDVVSVSMTTNELCVTQNTVSSNSITMSITTSVVPSVSIESASGTNVCKGSTLSLNANATNGGSAPIYNWTINGSSIGTSPTITTPAISGPTTVEVTLTSNDNCANGATATQSISIDVYELPILNVSSTPSNCAGISTGSVSVAVTGGSPALSYSWNTVPVATTATVNNLAGGTYTVTITYGNGCTITSDATVESSSITLSSSVIIGQTTEQNPSGSVSINVAGGTPPYSYVWNTTPPQFLNTATELTSGTYSVIVTDASGCSAIFEFNVPNSVGVKDINNEEFEVFPNPTKNILYLKSNSNANATTYISIVDVSGKIVLNEIVNLQAKNLQTIDLSVLPRGVYFLLLTRDNLRINKKVVKL
jgi:hypothetical protein